MGRLVVIDLCFHVSGDHKGLCGHFVHVVTLTMEKSICGIISKCVHDCVCACVCLYEYVCDE